jgi:Uri superfamily endonuclease
LDIGALKSGGTYVLWLHLASNRRIGVGRLGDIDFAAGYYGYVGSAQGPGGLAARAGRHLRGGLKLRWHIDYLRHAAHPAALWCCVSSRRWEHDWAVLLAAVPGGWMPALGFGASDCRCPAHLFGFKRLPAPEILADGQPARSPRASDGITMRRLSAVPFSCPVFLFQPSFAGSKGA